MDLKTEIEIHCSPETVWEVLTQFKEYPQWNPLFVHAWGPIEVGSRLDFKVAQPGGRELRWRPVVTLVEPQRALRWKGHFLFRGLFDGEQFFELEALPQNHTRLIHGEIYQGLLVSHYSSRIAQSARGFAAMNQAIKRRAERLAH